MPTQDTPLARLCKRISAPAQLREDHTPDSAVNADLAPDSEETGVVNLQEVSDTDWDNLKKVQNGQTVDDQDSLDWLKACGLVHIEGESVVLSRLAQEWLSTPQEPSMNEP
jgi:hypothetical protein